jgi:arylsulfatase A-like enzyme
MGCSLHPYHKQTLPERTERAVLLFSELPQSRINEDLRCIAAAAETVQQHQPELLIFNLQGADICHSNYTAYCENLHLADYGLGRLWQIIQNTPGMANNTVLIVAPEHGRNHAPNSISDANNLFGYDHSDDVQARNIFCLIAGPAEIVGQNRVTDYVGESIDILPSIAHLLGFENELDSMPGKILHDAFSVTT